MSPDTLAVSAVPPRHTAPAPNAIQRRAGRLAGLLYLLQMATAVCGFAVHGRLIVADAARTAENIAASEWLFRLGMVSDLLTTVLVITLTWTLWVVLAPVGRHGALLAAFFRVVENAIAAASLVGDVVALRLLSGAGYLAALPDEHLHALARLFAGVQGAGLQMAFVFVGLGSAVFSLLWWRSRYVPRLIAGWGIVASLLLAVVTLLILVWPGLGGRLGLSYMMPMGVYEVGLGFWLLVRGLRSPEGGGRTASAETPARPSPTGEPR